ncbi:hypothetical protein [Paenibacillus riograndensis]|uniref:Putative secreted protein n=1 Tax=Paenibacillus riograndensis SBR5 TaxID=1073571 RepID=A0A0E4HAY9_9BACL|nr:hypothetical protein [Paenibacillus riograndensis]CQR52754.1 putative secreted protein [Paenibacillus riograndensis SBR5]
MHRKETFRLAAGLAGLLAIALTAACSGGQAGTVHPAAEASAARIGSQGMSSSNALPTPAASAEPAAQGNSAVPSSAAPASSASLPEVRHSVSIDLQGKSYVFPAGIPGTERYNFATVTAKGIVWSPAPKLEREGSNPVWIPLEPFSLYLSDPANPQLGISAARKLFTQPLPEKSNEYTKLGSLRGVGDYVIYHTYTMFRGGAQALKSQAWAMKIGDSAQPAEILSFHAAGGYLYFWGIEEQEKLYVSVSQIPGNADGSYTYEVYVYSMADKRKEKLHKFSLKGSQLKFSFHNQSYEVKLQQG